MSSSDWDVAEPESGGLKRGPLDALVEWLDGFDGANIHGVVIARGGKLLFEHYRAGEDQCWGEPIGRVTHGPDTRHDLRSVTKSVMSLLFGIALDRKLIGSIDQPVFDWFPDYRDLRTPEKERILFRHLLTMSSGLEWDEYDYSNPGNSELCMLRSSDQYRYALERPIASPPGKVWTYNSGSSLLLEAVIARAAGADLAEFARESLLTPLGIADFDWTRNAATGMPEVGGLRLRARDFARIGQLVLAGGSWNGRQVVSRRWIEESTAAQIGPADRLFYYGYQWWQGRSLLGGRDVQWILAMGLGGQRIFIVPALDLVVVVTAGMYANPIQAWLPLVIFNRYVLAAIAGA